MKDETSPRKLQNPADVAAFAFAGNATLTLVSTKTGSRFTFKISAPDEPRQGGPSHFVSLMQGLDNESSFCYLGLFRSGQYEHGRRSETREDAPSAKAFSWFAATVLRPGATAIPPSLEVWHEGRCGRCNRKLTVPESIESGFGPECAGRVRRPQLCEAA